MARSDLFRKVQQWLRVAQLENKQSGAWEQILEKRLNRDLSRRTLLHSSGHLLAWSSLPACLTQMSALPKPAEPLPIISGPVAFSIVGAGLAGLTAAYELTKAGIKVQIFEGGQRAGGRVYTEYNFNEEKMFCERGGEFVDSGHEDLLVLAHDLGINVQALASQQNHSAEVAYFFGGRFRSEKELIKAFAPLAKIINKSVEKVLVNGELIVPTYKEPISDAVKALDRSSLAAYLDACRKEVDPWVLELIRVAYVGEYGLEAAEQSALNLLLMIDPETKEGFRLYGESDEAFRIQGGSSRLVEALEKKLLEAGVKIQLQHRLVATRAQGEGLSLVFDASGRTVEVASNNTILALPQPLLKSIDGLAQLELSAVKKRLIQELGIGSNSKLMLGFKERYWLQAGKGKAFPANSGSIYTEQQSQAFWDSSRRQEGSSGILANFLGGNAGKTIGPGKVPGVLLELEKMMPGISKLYDGRKILQHWPSSPLALGSYLCPKPGQYTELIGSAEESELNHHLHFVGEYCSVDFGGYMNGAVASAKSLSQRLTAKVEAK